MDGIIIESIKGNFCDYSKITALAGYCFYDKDEEERNYLTSITTPIIDLLEIERKYVVVQGDAEELNAKLEEERLKEVADGEV